MESIAELLDTMKLLKSQGKTKDEGFGFQDVTIRAIQCRGDDSSELTALELDSTHEIQILGPHPRSTGSKTLRVGPRYKYFNKPSR